MRLGSAVLVPLLLLADRAGLLRRHRGDAGLPARDEQVGDLLALGGPPGHRRGRAVLQVVGVGGDAQRPLPVRGEGLQAHASISSTAFSRSRVRAAGERCRRRATSAIVVPLS